MAIGVELASVGVELIPGIAGADNITIGTSTITSGTNLRVLYDNNGVIGEYVTGSASSANSVVLRDANQNSYANNWVSKSESVVSAGATTVLTAASARLQTLTGTLSQTFQLPDATTLTVGTQFQFNDNSSQSLSIVNNGSGAISTVLPGGKVVIECTGIGTTNGTWDTHVWAPQAVSWGSNSFRVATTTPIPAGGSAGNGMTFFSTANFGVFFGSGAPTLAAAKGSLYLRSNGSTTNDRAYINTDGGTTWTALTTAA